MHQTQGNKDDNKSLPVSSPNIIGGNVVGPITASDNFSSLKSASNISRLAGQMSASSLGGNIGSSVGGLSGRESEYNSNQEPSKHNNSVWQKKQLQQKSLLESAFKKKILPIDSCHLRLVCSIVLCLYLFLILLSSKQGNYISLSFGCLLHLTCTRLCSSKQNGNVGAFYGS